MRRWLGPMARGGLGGDVRSAVDSYRILIMIATAAERRARALRIHGRPR